MDALKKLQTIEEAFGAAVGIVLAEQFAPLMKQWLLISGSAAVFSVILVTISILFVRFLIGSLFERSKTVRKILLGKNYIEGIWFDVMREKGQVKEIGVSSVEYADFQIKYSGEDYDLAVTQRLPFMAEMAQLKRDGVMMYKYTARRSDTDRVGTPGYGELQFHSGRHGMPTRYTGEYFLLNENTKCSFEGFKLDEKKDKELLELLDSGETRKEALRRLKEKYS